MSYYFEFEECRLRTEEVKRYKNLIYHYSQYTKAKRVDYYYSKRYETFREVLRDYHRLIVKSGQRPKPCFYFNTRITYELMSQSKNLYNYYVSHVK